MGVSHLLFLCVRKTDDDEKQPLNLLHQSAQVLAVVSRHPIRPAIGEKTLICSDQNGESSRINSETRIATNMTNTHTLLRRPDFIGKGFQFKTFLVMKSTTRMLLHYL